MVGKYRRKSKYLTNEGKYRKDNKYHTNGKEIQE
jgi:hypothetical protein